MAPTPSIRPKPASGTLVTAGPRVNPFPRPPDITLAKNDKLKDAVVKAVNDDVTARNGPPAEFAISIADPSNNVIGGFNGDHEYYSGSVVKVGVLYAAHGLLEMVRRRANLLSPKSADDLFVSLRADMKAAIERSSLLIFGGANPQQRLPSYEKVLAVKGSGGKLQIAFNTTYSNDLRLMIVNRDNDAAGRCIHGLGFSYLNGALEQGGFFDPKSKTGIWAAGDFHHGWTPVRIRCENMPERTGGTAQGATTDALAWVFAIIVLGNVFDDPSSHISMKNLLKSAAAESWLVLPNLNADRLDASQVTHAKIGLGEDPRVYSEVAIIKGIAPKTDKIYMVAWQNIDWSFYWTRDIVTIIKNAIRVYET